MELDCQSISIYGDFVTSLTAYYSCADINISSVIFSWKIGETVYSAIYSNSPFTTLAAGVIIDL